MNHYDCYLARKDISSVDYVDQQSQAPAIQAPNHHRTEKVLQLLGLASLYVVCKNEGCGCSIRLFVKLSIGKFSQQNIETMELDLMSTLEWLINPPRPQDFAVLYNLLLSSLSSDSNREGVDNNCTNLNNASHFLKVVREVSNYIVEVFVQYNEYKFEQPSTLAFAAILISLHGTKYQGTVMKNAFIDLMEGILCSTSSQRNDNGTRVPVHTTIERVHVLQEEMIIILKRQFNNDSIQQVFSEFDPQGIVYESDPPALVEDYPQ
jgi:hypothetical protein